MIFRVDIEIPSIISEIVETPCQRHLWIERRLNGNFVKLIIENQLSFKSKVPIRLWLYKHPQTIRIETICRMFCDFVMQSLSGNYSTETTKLFARIIFQFFFNNCSNNSHILQIWNHSIKLIYYSEYDALTHLFPFNCIPWGKPVNANAKINMRKEPIFFLLFI